MGDEPDGPPKIVRQCSLDKPTQELVRMIFDNDMFNNAMQKLELGKCKVVVKLRTLLKQSNYIFLYQLLTAWLHARARLVP